jgi:hypothetical protein
LRAVSEVSLRRVGELAGLGQAEHRERERVGQVVVRGLGPGLDLHPAKQCRFRDDPGQLRRSPG